MGGSCQLQAQASMCLKRSQALSSLTRGQGRQETGKALSGEATPILALELHLLIASCVPSSLPRDGLRIQHLENRLCELLIGATGDLYFYTVPVSLGVV